MSETRTIGYVLPSKILACIESGREVPLGAAGSRADWLRAPLRADCLYEIGRGHFQAGRSAIAQSFLRRALPPARAANRLRGAAPLPPHAMSMSKMKVMRCGNIVDSQQQEEKSEDRVESMVYVGLESRWKEM